MVHRLLDEDNKIPSCFILTAKDFKNNLKQTSDEKTQEKEE